MPCGEPAAFAALLREATRRPWVVYAKRPFAAPETVFAYLARYTHPVGITNRRILSLDAASHTVTFDYKDYADGARHKRMTLTCEEFVRRLQFHILPARFVKLRHYGLLANRNRHTRACPTAAAATTDGRDSHRFRARGSRGIATVLPKLSSAGQLGAD